VSGLPPNADRVHSRTDCHDFNSNGRLLVADKAEARVLPVSPLLKTVLAASSRLMEQPSLHRHA
jgi:hypothetical protein